MRKSVFILCMGLVMAITACGTTTTPVITKGPVTFTFVNGKLTGSGGATSYTIKAGIAVQFVDPASGVPHFLATGTNGIYFSESNAPRELSANPGKEIDPGQTVTIPFTTPGTFHITCTIHTMQNVTVVVVP